MTLLYGGVSEAYFKTAPTECQKRGTVSEATGRKLVLHFMSWTSQGKMTQGKWCSWQSEAIDSSFVILPG